MSTDGAAAGFRNGFSSDFRSKHRVDPVPPVADGFMADIDAALVQKILDVSKRKGKADVYHHRRADYSGVGFEMPKRERFVIR